ncbi:MAG: twin-arginine translocase TatA/TatE family subunit [Actinomycetota bacterium]|jgi:sec-independent protein translocase protein TatA
MEWGVVAVIAVAVLFGATKLPDIARNIGRAQGEFKKGLKEGAVDDTKESTEPKTES